MYENHTAIVEGMCVKRVLDRVYMCDKVRHPSGQVDATPVMAIKHPGGFVCESYAFPRSRKKVGGCALCSIQDVGKAKDIRPMTLLNPIKASKRK